MKPILPALFMLLALSLTALSEETKILITLDDIKELKVAPDDPFAEPFDLALLKKLEMAMKSLPEIESAVTRATVQTALEAAIEDFRKRAENSVVFAWDAPFDDNKSKKEFTSDEAQALWKKSPWKRSAPTFKGGGPIDWANARKITPLGLSVMTAGGFKWIPFEELCPEFCDVFGWDEDARVEYTKDRNLKADEAYAAIPDEPVKAKLPATPSKGSASPASVTAGIKAYAQAKWKDDYSMVAYEIKKQTEAYQEISVFRKSVDPAMRKIITTATVKWQDDYGMILYEIKRQSEAKSAIGE